MHGPSRCVSYVKQFHFASYLTIGGASIVIKKRKKHFSAFSLAQREKIRLIQTGSNSTLNKPSNIVFACVNESLAPNTLHDFERRSVGKSKAKVCSQWKVTLEKREKIEERRKLNQRSHKSSSLQLRSDWILRYVCTKSGPISWSPPKNIIHHAILYKKYTIDSGLKSLTEAWRKKCIHFFTSRQPKFSESLKYIHIQHTKKTALE